MNRFMRRTILSFILFAAWIHVCHAFDDVIRLAVSTSIHSPISSICQKFSQSTRYKCKIASAPTGHLYAHIMHGMAYDLFISSDQTYTAGLLNAQKALPDSRFVVAKGRIVLASADQQATAESLQAALLNQPNASIVMASPGISSYGSATKEVLQSYNLWQQVQGRLVYGKDIKQSYDLMMTKRVPLGFVSLAQLPMQARDKKRYWEPDPNSYKGVLHEALVLKTQVNTEAVKAFIDFVQSESSCHFFEDAGFHCGNSKHT